jgi:hypothetical protein
LNSLNGSIHHLGPQTKDENAFGDAQIVGAEHIRDQPQATTKRPVGSDLTAVDYEALESRWIDRALADRAGLRRVDSLTGSEIIGRRSGDYAGIIIPYFRPGSSDVREYRLCRDQPDLEYDAAGNLRPRQKYLSPPGRSNMLYLVAGIDPSFLRDTSLPIAITEGEFKALSAWQTTSPEAGPGSCRSASQACTIGAARSVRPSVQTAVAWM